MFYVKANSNCEGLPLTSLEELLGGAWMPDSIWEGKPLICTGEDLKPRQVVGWSSLSGGSPCNVKAFIREDGVQIALLGGDWGVRILATDDDEWESPFGEDHLPPGWGTPILTVEDFDDIEDKGLRAAIDAALN